MELVDLRATEGIPEGLSSAEAERLKAAGKVNISDEKVGKSYGKIIRDDESADMLDIILANRVFDIGWYYQFGNYTEDVMNMLRNKNNNFASMYQKNESMALAEISELYYDFLEVAN